MAQSSTNLASFMKESVPVTRWYIYSLRFLFLFSWFLATSQILASQVRLEYIFGSATALTAIGLFTERYRERFADPRYEWVRIVLVWAAIIILVTMAWRHEVHKPDTNAPYKSQNSSSYYQPIA